MRRFPAGYEFPSNLYCPNNATAAFRPVMGTSVLCFAEVGTASIPESRLPSEPGISAAANRKRIENLL